MESQATTVEKQLPYLRRYARAITGSQDAGDSRVVACLQAALAGALAPDLEARGVRIELFRILHDTWPTAPAAAPDERAAAHADVATRLIRVPERARRLLALTTLEGFPLEDAATILRITPGEATEALETGRQQMREQGAARVLIIEDEPVIALDIASIVRRAGHTVVGMASTHEEAVTLARQRAPELVLADIQLADDSSGIEAVAEIFQDGPVPVIFITAFPERLLTGQRPEPAFLITKPFDPEALRVSIFQALCSIAPSPLEA